VADTNVRDATVDDFPAIAAIAEAGDSEADDLYLAFIASAGALRVAAGDGAILGFGGVIAIGSDTTMVTDLFIAPAVRGRGLGGALLEDLLGDVDKRMTFSSKHAAALPAYVRAGMQPCWRLLYLRGPSGAHHAHADRAAERASSWRGERPNLAAYYERRGGSVRDNAVLIEHDGETSIARLQDRRGAAAFDALLASLPSDSTVTCCSPEGSPVAARALARGFDVFDHDIFCCSPGLALADDLHCLDPGLC
jgi:GNAT superfamily N-acetyltransferase